MNEKDKLWVKVFSQKYITTGSVLTEQMRLGGSYVWRGILKARDSVAGGYGPRLGAGTSSFWYSNWLGTRQLAGRVLFVHITDTELTVADTWRQGTWNIGALYTMLSDEIREEIMAVQIPTRQEGVDRILWKEENDGIYSTSSTYKFLTEDDTQESQVWKLIWKAMAPEKVRLFLWLVGKDALPTNAKHHRSHLASSPTCTRCGAAVENAEHILRHCPRSIWIRTQFRNRFPWTQGTTLFMTWLVTHLQSRNHTLFCAMAWNLWKWRNSFVIEQTPWPLGEVMRRIHLDMVEFTRWGKATQQQQRTTVAGVDDALVMVHTYGSYLPRENKMGAGGVVRDKDGRWISGFAASLGVGDAFKAELLAIQKGLNHVWEMGYISVVCYTDCIQATEVLGMNIDITNY